MDLLCSAFVEIALRTGLIKKGACSGIRPNTNDMTFNIIIFDSE